MDEAKLEEMARLVQGNGCIIRHGHEAFRWSRPDRMQGTWSAMKPVLSTLLVMGVQDGRLPGIDCFVADVEPRLRTLADGTGAAITWRQLASQTSGYGLAEDPGKAFAYNDYAIALYYDSLFRGVLRANGDAVFRERIADPLGFEDEYDFEREGKARGLGLLKISARDFARFGLLLLRHGEWNGRTLIQPELVDTMLHSRVPAALPMTSGERGPMLPGQRTIGARSLDNTEVGPGFYSFNWWLNADKRGDRLIPEAPADAVFALGLWGRCLLMIIPSWDIVVSWNESEVLLRLDKVNDTASSMNAALKLIRESLLAENG